MKKCLVILLVLSFAIGGCATNKPYYKTSEGKRKQKYYNEIQFGGRKAKKGY